jgi:hypothetical protein
MNDPDPLKKYEELYELTKNGLADELEGLRQLEEKASRYLSVMGILLGISSIGVKVVIETILPTKTFFDNVVTLTLFLFLILAFSTILILFTVFKTRELSHFPINAELIQFFTEHNFLDSIFALTRGNVQAVETNRSVRLDKIRRLSYGYILMIWAIAFMAMFTCSLLARPYVNNSLTPTRSSIMPDEQQSKPSESTPADNKPASSNEQKPDASVKPPTFDTIQRNLPNANVKPPNYVMFKEGYDPKAGKNTPPPSVTPKPDTSKKDE